MAGKTGFKFGIMSFGVFLLIVLMVALIGRYERNKRTERFAEEQSKFDALNEALPDMDTVRRLQVVDKQRVQPLDTLARRKVREISGRRKIYGTDQVATFLSMAFDGLAFWDDIPCISVQHLRNKEALGVHSADNMATPRQADLVLAKDKDESVRTGLAEKIAKVAPGLTASEKDQVRKAAHDTLEVLARDGALAVRQAAALALTGSDQTR